MSIGKQVARGQLGPRLADPRLGRAFQGGEGSVVTPLLLWQGCSGVREGGWAYRKHRDQNRHTDSGVQNGGRAWTSSPDTGDPIPLGQQGTLMHFLGRLGKVFSPRRIPSWSALYRGPLADPAHGTQFNAQAQKLWLSSLADP